MMCLPTSLTPTFSSVGHTASKETVKKCGLDDPLFGQLPAWIGQEGRDVYLFFCFFCHTI